MPYRTFKNTLERRFSKNTSLQNFEATKKSFKSKGIPDGEILAYHGTDPVNIDSILKNNLKLEFAKRQLHGKGNYFSEYPGVSIGYGRGLLLCRILPGKEYQGGGDIPKDYNSKKVLLNQTGSAAAGGTNVSGKMIIIENSNQILPYFVIHRHRLRQSGDVYALQSI